jgi:hypothetical protein
VDLFFVGAGLVPARVLGQPRGLRLQVIFHRRDTEAAQRLAKKFGDPLSIKTTFRSPPCEIETPSHPTVQTNNISLTGTSKRTTQYVVTTAKQATADGFNEAIVAIFIPARGNKIRLDQP